MKKLLLVIAAVAMLLPSCKKFEDAINALDNRVTKLEGEKIPSIEQQIESINTSIADLETVDIALKEQIAELEKSAETTAEEIVALKAKDAELEQMIKTLQEYANSLNQSTKDWVSATFATLEQFNSLSLEVASLKTVLENYKVEVANNLANAISALETSMKQWVNEQLANYYTIAQIDAKIAALEQQIQNGGTEELVSEINSLKSSLQTMKSELTTAYQKAIADAINTNNGVINAKIAEEIAAVNQRITNEINAIKNRLNDIEKRVSDLEDKVEDLMNRKLEITFEDTENIAILAGGSCKVDYTVTSSESEVHIATIAQNGWKASVTKSTEKTGYITVYAPNPLTTEPIIVLVSDANTTIMRSLTFVDGVISIETTSFSLTNEATTLSIGVSTNLDYTVSIPSTASSWISLQNITSRATMRNDVVNLNIEENTSTYNREAVLSIIFNDVKVGEIAISQQGVIIANNQLIYTSSDGAIITPYQTIGFNANIISNTCVNGRGIITFDNDITTISEYAFYNCTNLTSIRMPKSVDKIKDYAFYNSGLKSAEIAEGVTNIGICAFSNCSYLTTVVMGDDVQSIGRSAFSNSAKLSSVTLSKKITLIENGTFQNCPKLQSIIIPNNVTSIGDYAFNECDRLTGITIPDGVTSIGEYAFYFCSSLTSITIPNSVASIGERAFSYCSALTDVTIGSGVTTIGYQAFFYSKNIKVVNISDLSSWCNVEFSGTESNPLLNKGRLYINNTEVIELVIPSDVGKVKPYTFANCSSLNSVVIQNGVTDIGDYTFYKCENLKNVVIEKSVSSIGNYAFESCASLTSVYCKPTTPPKVGYYTFSKPTNVFNIYVPRNSYETYISYKSAYTGALGKDNWSRHDDYVEPYDFE